MNFRKSSDARGSEPSRGLATQTALWNCSHVVMTGASKSWEGKQLPYYSDYFVLKLQYDFCASKYGFHCLHPIDQTELMQMYRVFPKMWTSGCGAQVLVQEMIGHNLTRKQQKAEWFTTILPPICLWDSGCCCSPCWRKRWSFVWPCAAMAAVKNAPQAAAERQSQTMPIGNLFLWVHGSYNYIYGIYQYPLVRSKMWPICSCGLF